MRRRIRIKMVMMIIFVSAKLLVGNNFADILSSFIPQSKLKWIEFSHN